LKHAINGSSFGFEIEVSKKDWNIVKDFQRTFRNQNNCLKNQTSGWFLDPVAFLSFLFIFVKEFELL